MSDPPAGFLIVNHKDASGNFQNYFKIDKDSVANTPEGQYNLFIHATEDCGVARSDPPHESVKFKFTVFLFVTCDSTFLIVQDKLPSEITYQLKSTAEPKSTPTTVYKFADPPAPGKKKCEVYTPKYTLTYSEGALPSWISLSNPSAPGTIDIATNDAALGGTTHTFSLKVENTGAPNVSATQEFTVSFVAGSVTSISCSNCPLPDVTYYLG